MAKKVAKKSAKKSVKKEEKPCEKKEECPCPEKVETKEECKLLLHIINLRDIKECLYKWIYIKESLIY